MPSGITMRHPTRSKAKSFQGAQSGFVFPVDSPIEAQFSLSGNNSAHDNDSSARKSTHASHKSEVNSIFSKDEYYLSNHYILNASVSANLLSGGSMRKNNHVMKRSSILMTQELMDSMSNKSSSTGYNKWNNNTKSVSRPNSESSVPISSNEGSYQHYSFANISDNTTTRSSIMKVQNSSSGGSNPGSGSDSNSESNYDQFNCNYSHFSRSSPTRRTTVRKTPVSKNRNSIKITRKATFSDNSNNNINTRPLNTRLSVLSRNDIRNITLDPQASISHVENGNPNDDHNSVFPTTCNTPVSLNLEQLQYETDSQSEHSSVMLETTNTIQKLNNKFMKSPSVMSLSSMTSEIPIGLPKMKINPSSSSSLIETPSTVKKIPAMSFKIQPNGTVENEDEADDNMLMSTNTKTTRQNERVSSLKSSSSKSSNIKRSNAVRCKGGLLNFFIKIGRGTKKSFQQWKSAIKRKFNRNSKKSKNVSNKSTRVNSLKRSTSMNFKTTNHLKRNFYTNVNIKRSMSTLLSKSNSIRRNLSLNTQNVPKINSPLQQNTLEDASHSKRKSLRRSPSSIKRAVSIMNNIDQSEKKTELPYSKASLQLSSYVIPRSPSVVVNNKVFPLDSFREEDIAEESEGEEEIVSKYSTVEEQDDYVINTEKMTSYSSKSSTSSKSGNSVYEDAVEEYTPTLVARNIESQPLDINYIDDKYVSDSEASIYKDEDTQLQSYDSSSIYSAKNLLSEIIEEEEEEYSSDDDEEDQLLDITYQSLSNTFSKNLAKTTQDTPTCDTWSEKTLSEDEWVDIEEDKEVLPLLMKHYLSSVIQKRILMNLELNSLQRTYGFNDYAQQIVKQVLSDYECSTQVESACGNESSGETVYKQVLHNKDSVLSTTSFVNLRNINTHDIRRSLTLPVSFR